jgi:hypothetical protein
MQPVLRWRRVPWHRLVLRPRLAVPHTVSREIEVSVTRYVQKTIQTTVQVPVTEACTTCNQ